MPQLLWFQIKLMIYNVLKIYNVTEQLKTINFYSEHNNYQRIINSYDICSYTGAPIVGIARWSVPRIGQGHLEVKW